MTTEDIEKARRRNEAPPPEDGGRESAMQPLRTPARRLDFDVVIATRNRPEALALSIPLILGQSRLPRKLIVIDSSDDHAPVAKIVAETVAGAGAGWNGTVIVEHTERGSSYQRNRGLEHVEAPVVIFPDDDSLFHPGTSEAIMRVYEIDTESRIAGVCAADAPEPPPGALAEAGYALASADRRHARAAQLRRRLGLEFSSRRPWIYLGRLLMERAKPPDWFEAENCVLVEEMWGYRMSFRTAVIRANPFDETLRNYAYCEDLDASLAATQHGCLAGALNARIYHHKFPTPRGDPYTTGLINVLNRGYVTLKHVHDAGLRPSEARKVRRLLRQFFGLTVLRHLPRLYQSGRREEMRGMLAGLGGVRAMLNAPRDDLSRVYSETSARALARRDR